MMKNLGKFALLIALVAFIALSSAWASEAKGKASMMKKPFGTAADVAYANNLWNKMEQLGYNSTPSVLFTGPPPHGQVIEVLEGKINGKRIIVKRNYYGKGITPNAVKANRSKYLKAITIMAKRSGYDPEDKNWFWVKYKPNGTIFKNKKGMPLAGRVAKGMKTGCIACHSLAPSGDMIYIHDKKLIKFID